VTQVQVDFGHVWHNTLTALDANGLPPTQRAFLRQAKFVGLLEQTALLAVPTSTPRTSLRPGHVSRS